MIALNGGACADRDGVFDGVAEFAKIARPVVLREGVDGVFGEAQGALCVGEEVLCEARDVGNPFFQGGKIDFKHSQAVVEVLAETSVFYFLAKVSVGGGDQA